MTQKKYQQLTLQVADGRVEKSRQPGEEFRSAFLREFRREAKKQGYTDAQIDAALERYSSI